MPRPGRYVLIGGAVYAVMMVGGVLFFISDVIAKGPIEAGKEWGLMSILTARIAASAGGAVAGVVGIVLFMPSDQAGAGDEAAARERADVIDAVIHDAFEDVVGPRRVLCIGDCTPGNRHIFDPERYGRLHDKVTALMANAWEVEDDETAMRRKREQSVAEERRREEEHDLAERVRADKELAGYREAMHRPVGFYVHSSVGEDATNDPEDVKRVAKRLHELGFLDTLTEDLDAIGDAIYLYQASVLHIPKPDSRIDPRGKTEAALRAGRRISMRSNSRGSGTARRAGGRPPGREGQVSHPFWVTRGNVATCQCVWGNVRCAGSGGLEVGWRCRARLQRGFGRLNMASEADAGVGGTACWHRCCASCFCLWVRRRRSRTAPCQRVSA